MNALEIRGLCKSYPGFEIRHLDLTLPGGCIMGLIGENGAGKSTIIQAILNMIRFDGGSITVLGRDNHDNFELTKEDLGVVLDSVGLPGCFNAKQVGRIMREAFRNWDDSEYDGYLKRFAIPENKKLREFSNGMWMRIAFAVAMSHHPKLLILDEATNGLDPVARDEVMDLINEFTREEGHSVLMASHIVSDLEKICDYIAFLHDGELLLCEEKDRLLEDYCVIHCTKEELKRISQGAVKGVRSSAYGVEAVVRRDAVPSGVSVSPVDIEQLFVFMVKRGDAA